MQRPHYMDPEIEGSTAIPTTSKGNEHWKYTNLKPIVNTNFNQPIIQEYPDEQFETKVGQITFDDLEKHIPFVDAAVLLVFIDGYFASHLSSMPLNFRTTDFPVEIEKSQEKYFWHSVPTEDVFSNINNGAFYDGAMIQLPSMFSPNKYGNDFNDLIQIIHVSTNPKPPTETHPRTVITTHPNSKSTILECHVSLTDKTHLNNSVTQIFLGENSHLTYYQLINQNPEAYQINSTYVHQEKNSTFDSISIAKGASILRNELKIKLAGEQSECSLKGLYFTSGSEHIDNHIMIDHAVPKAKSEIFYKGILDDKSKAVFSGGVLVRENAQKTVAKQTDKNLLLSKGARINTKPMLEIYADDVECAHGATAGSIASEALFYMQSRGIGLDMARRLLINGFANQIIDDVQVESLKKYLHSNWLPN